VSLCVKRYFISNGCVDNRCKLIRILICWTIGNHIPSFDMIGKKYFEYWVMRVMYIHIDSMILSTGIGCILNLMEFNIRKILNNLNLLNFPILFHNPIDIQLIHLQRFQPTNKQLPYKNTLMYFLYRFRLMLQLLLMS
jgi:hypothetical protein